MPPFHGDVLVFERPQDALAQEGGRLRIPDLAQAPDQAARRNVCALFPCWRGDPSFEELLLQGARELRVALEVRQADDRARSCRSRSSLPGSGVPQQLLPRRGVAGAAAAERPGHVVRDRRVLLALQAGEQGLGARRGADVLQRDGDVRRGRTGPCARGARGAGAWRPRARARRAPARRRSARRRACSVSERLEQRDQGRDAVALDGRARPGCPARAGACPRRRPRIRPSSFSIQAARSAPDAGAVPSPASSPSPSDGASGMPSRTR